MFETVLAVFHSMAAFLSIWALIFILQTSKLVKCLDRQAVFRKSGQKYLENHVVETKHADTDLECRMYCLRNTLCASVNYKISVIDKGLCELNNKTCDVAEAMTHNPEFNHFYIIEKVGIEGQHYYTLYDWR